MVKMIPPSPRGAANNSEQAVFRALEGILDRPDWVVIHSLSLTDNLFSIAGEADFVVFVPGKGIVVIEAKAPNYVEYRDGDWYLDKTPKPDKSPLEQLNKATSSIYRFLENRELYKDLPIARLLWFTNLARFQFINHTPGDMQFYEWELGLQEDLAKPAAIIEKVLDEHIKTHKDRRDLTLAPEDFDAASAKAAAGALINDFKLYRTPESRYVERKNELRKLLDEQITYLDLFEDNSHIYLDGAAGTGKSFLLLEAARRLSKRGTKTLLACWNVMMAEELRRELGPRANVDVFDLNTVMLQIYGLPANPKSAGTNWYETQLPEYAIKALTEKPELSQYEAILIDEFQDIAGNFKVLEFLIEATSAKSLDGTKLIFAGDRNQQIMATRERLADPYSVIKEYIPDLVKVSLRTNCRTVPNISERLPSLTGLEIDIVRHRLPESAEGGLRVVKYKDGKATKALAQVLRNLLEEFREDDIVILSPFGLNHSLVGELFKRESESADERWLKSILQDPNGPMGRITWRSISKFKGLESDVVIITDIDANGAAFAMKNGRSLGELLYVGASRAKVNCVVISDEATLPGWA